MSDVVSFEQIIEKSLERHFTKRNNEIISYLTQNFEVNNEILNDINNKHEQV
jgi:hypothetical protein